MSESICARGCFEKRTQIGPLTMRGAEEQEEKRDESDDLEDKDRCYITQELPFEHGRTKAQSAFANVDGDQFPARYCITGPAAHCLIGTHRRGN